MWLCREDLAISLASLRSATGEFFGLGDDSVTLRASQTAPGATTVAAVQPPRSTRAGAAVALVRGLRHLRVLPLWSQIARGARQIAGGCRSSIAVHEVMEGVGDRA